MDPAGTTPLARYIARHGSMRHLGEFEAAPMTVYARNQQVILRTPRGLEAGDILCASTPQAVQMIVEPTGGQIIRALTDADRTRLDQLRAGLKREFELAAGHIASLRLQMQLVDVEHLFGGERIVFYFLADKRVDFREL